MYVAYKYIKKKRNEKREQKQQKQDQQQQQQGHAVSQATAVNTASSGLAMTPAEEPPKVPPDPKSKEREEKSEEDKQREKAEKKRRYIYRCKIIFGLMMPFTLQGLDTTIVASALPYIAADFDQLAQLNWIISAFNLTSAAFLPFWSQIADIFGRHTTIHATLVVMLVGSAICTGAPTHAFGVLLLGRALQGVGASGINICVRTILADRVSLKEYAVHWTLFALISAFSFSIGPVIGGYLNETSWRWCFAINLPVAVAAIVLVVVLLRNDLLGPQPLPQLTRQNIGTRHGRFLARMGTLDLGGQLLFLWGLGLVILALTWAGGAYGWGTAHVLAPLVVGLVLTAAWVVYEYLMTPGKVLSRALPTQRPMMPWELLSQRDIGLLFWINFSLGTAMFSNMYFMDLYFALVEGNSSSKAGLSLLYFLPGLGVGAYSAMFASNVWPRQTLPPLLLGGVTSAVGVTVLAYAVHAGRTSLVYGMMALTGHGVGIRMNPGSLHGLAYFPQATAAISCIVAFAMPFGGTVTLTLMSTVFNNKGGSAGDAEQTKSAIMWAFIAVIPFVWVPVVLTTFLGNVWIRKDETHEVCLSPYLWSLLFRRPVVKEVKSRVDETHFTRELHPAKDEESVMAVARL
ncbi:mfs transporter [Ophiostoma piceae UAMH 11346]|uniref:Mfs transporter n=1 Tax=Ophiostoma piceae (strain UAMH 11346) TaxID=1262450 RepID=S3BMH0_OPHP1|nr:mfs transporter [Ophiostoma piceae UAMH 11346]